MKVNETGAVSYSVGTVLIGILVVMAGVLVVGRESLRYLLAGTAVAVAVQVAVYWVFFVWFLPERQALAHGLGAAVRLVAVGLMAFLGVAALGLEAAPTLLSMVACLFGSTLWEALVLHRRGVARVGPGVATIR